MQASSEIRMLTVDDLDAYEAHVGRQGEASGRDGDMPYGPYGAETPHDAEATRAKAHRRWTTEVGEPNWRRAWGLWVDGALVGSVDLGGGGLRTELHRANLGVSIERAHRGKGFGRALTETALEWARRAPGIDWVELGVFAGNDRAHALYQKLGFVECGRIEDRFRVDGRVIDDIHMVLRVGSSA